MITYKLANTTTQLKQILTLQQQNLAKNLTDNEMVQEGFVTLVYTLEQLQQMNTLSAHSIALYKNKVVGYALAMHPSYKTEIPAIQPMCAKITTHYNKQDYLLMGQICVAKNHRGQGVFRGLYQHMQQHLPQNLNVIITEISVSNTRSMQAHEAIGFTQICEHTVHGKKWSIVVLK